MTMEEAFEKASFLVDRGYSDEDPHILARYLYNKSADEYNEWLRVHDVVELKNTFKF